MEEIEEKIKQLKSLYREKAILQTMIQMIANNMQGADDPATRLLKYTGDSLVDDICTIDKKIHYCLFNSER